MNKILLLALIFSVYSAVDCFRFTPLCKNSVFNHEEKEINGYFNLTLGVGLITDPFDDFVSNYKLSSNRFVQVNTPSLIKRVTPEDIVKRIRKIVEKKPLLDQGYLIKEIADKKFLTTAFSLIQNKPEESLTFDKFNHDLYYGKQIIKVTEFKFLYDKETGKKEGINVDFK